MQTSANNFELVQASNSTIERRFDNRNSFEVKRANNKASKIASQGRTTRLNKRGIWEGQL